MTLENTMHKTTIDFNAIKAQVPINVALAFYGVRLKHAGAKLTGCCPVHNGSNPRAFTVSADRRFWYCFGDCVRGGSVLDLVAGIEDCSLVEAAKLVSERHL